MRLIWPIIKNTGIYYWEEAFYLIFFNIVVALSLAPGLALLFQNMNRDIPPTIYVPISIILWSAFPYTLFGLFYTVHRIAKGYAIKLVTFFGGGLERLKLAYIWWVINVIAISLLISNITFYNQLEATWSGFVSLFFVGLLAVWLLSQIYALTFYPKLVKPSFKLATKNAIALLVMQPLPVLLIAAFSLLLAVTGIFTIPFLGALLIISLIATLVNMTTHHILKATPLPGQEAKTDS